MGRGTVLICLTATLFVGVQYRTAPHPVPDQQKLLSVLWQHPGDLALRDLYWGSGGAESAPRPPFTFVSEDTSGTKPKVDVTDATGVRWSVKFAGVSAKDNEVHADIAASRLTWAFGYGADESYFVPEGTILKVGKLARAASSIGPDGAFRSARFEKRPEHITRTGERWSFDKNPFVGSQELSGLKILTTMLGNWDASPANSDVLHVPGGEGHIEAWHVISDLGSTFGQMGLPTSFLSRHTRWNLDDYQKERLLDWASKEFIRLNYSGAAAIRDVERAHAQWFSALAKGLTVEQVSRAFQAAGATPADSDAYAQAFMKKIGELRTALQK